jgi:hypothetical protein
MIEEEEYQVGYYIIGWKFEVWVEYMAITLLYA